LQNAEKFYKEIEALRSIKHFINKNNSAFKQNSLGVFKNKFESLSEDTPLKRQECFSKI